MGTLYENAVYSDDYPERFARAIEMFGWEGEELTPAMVQAAVAYVAEGRRQYLVDRHDELAAGFADLLAGLFANRPGSDQT
jgi:hypothetical protein